MPQLIKDFPIHFTLAGLISIVIVIIIFTFNFTGTYRQVEINTQKIDVHDQLVNQIPAIQLQVDTIVKDTDHTRDAVDRIEQYLLNEK